MTGKRISIFPLAGALLFPGSYLPLHIFEPRYRALISDALARDRQIGMIQPRSDAETPDLFEVGCLGKIGEFEALSDGRYNIVLQGLSRFRVVRELDVTTPFRQVEGELIDDSADEAALAPATRAALEIEARRLADHLGYEVNWDMVSGLDDMTLVNSIAQFSPFEPASKQALLEADTLDARAEQTMQIMSFYGKLRGDGGATLQ